MKKILGWVLVICGIISFPGFIANISKARYGYEVIGMIIGQGLIFLLAYLCLRSKKEENNSESKQMGEIIQKKTIMKMPIIPKSNLTTSNFDTLINSNNDYPENCLFQKQQISTTGTNNIKEKTDGIFMSNETNKDYPSIDITSNSWNDIMSLLYNYQKKELMTKCNPQNYMEPYNHDRVEISNEITTKLRNVESLDDLKPIHELAQKLDVHISTYQIRDYLSSICNPVQYIGKELFKEVNDIYSEVVIPSNDYSKYEKILNRAKLIIELPQHESKFHIKNLFKKNIKLLIFILIWEIIQFFLWSYKGVLYNSYDYFFPFQTFDIAKYDITEFALYGVLFPIVITILTVQLKKILR